MSVYAKVSKDTNWNIIKYEDILIHTDKVLKYAFENVFPEDLELVSQISWWCENKIKQAVFFACFFHDIWKITKQFQNTILNGKKSFHAYYWMEIYFNLEKDFNFDFPVYNKFFWWQEFADIVLLSIWTHHSLLKENLYLQKDLEFDILEAELKSFLQNLPIFYEKYLNEKFGYKIDFNWFKKDFSSYWEKIVDRNWYNLPHYFSLRILYGYVSWILNIGDWLASADFDENLPTIHFKNQLNLDLNFRLKKFQEQLSKITQNVIVEIPTGEWKTEWSLLWAINNWKWKYNKIIYTLPTQITSNKMYDRLVNYFGQENVWIVHSSADLFLKDILKLPENEENFYLAEKNFNKLFSKPVTVSTLDAFLKFFINMWRWNIALVNKLNALLIIDEIHIYDLKLSGFLASLIQNWIFEELGIKIAILSASFPKTKKEKILWKNWDKKFEIVTQKELFNYSPNKIQLVDDYLEDNLEKISEYFSSKKVLIVRNTVKDAVDTYKLLKEKGYNVMLYHSKFRRVDRKLKEYEIYLRLWKEKIKSFSEEIILNDEYVDFNYYLKNLDLKNNFILVATQVVEISLDIDFDILLTDIAPIDSLIQRFWRVNREKKPNKIWKIFIFGKYYKVAGKYPYNDLILKLTFEELKNWKLSLKNLNEILEKVYRSFFNSKTVKNYLQKFDEWKKLFWNKLDETRWIFKQDEYDIRDIESLDIDVFLLKDYERYKQDWEKLNEKYLLPFRWYLLKSDYLFIEPDKKSKLYYPVINVDYSYEIGIDLKWKNENDIFMI